MVAVPRPGIIAMAIAALLFSANTALAKLLAGRGYSTFTVLYGRGLCTTLGSSAALAHARCLPIPHVAGTRRYAGWALARGIAGAAAIGCLYFAVGALPLTESVTLYALNPVFAMLFSRLLLQERVTLLRVAAAVLFVAGAAVVSGPFPSNRGSSSGTSTSSMSADPLLNLTLHVTANATANATATPSATATTLWAGRGVAIVGSGFSGAAIVFAKKMSTAGSLGVEPPGGEGTLPPPLHFLSQAWWQGAISMAAAPIAGLVSTQRPLRAAADAALLVAMGACAFLGQLGVGFAVQREAAGVIGVLWNIDIAFSLLWQWAFFADPATWFQVAGIALVLAASAAVILDRRVAASVQTALTSDTEGSPVASAPDTPRAVASVGVSEGFGQPLEAPHADDGNSGGAESLPRRVLETRLRPRGPGHGTEGALVDGTSVEIEVFDSPLTG